MAAPAQQEAWSHAEELGAWVFRVPHSQEGSAQAWRLKKGSQPVDPCSRTLPEPWPDRALLSSLGRVGPGLTLPGEACPTTRLGACNEKWVFREARRGTQSQAWRPSQQRGQGSGPSRDTLKCHNLPPPYPTGRTLRLEALLASTGPASAFSWLLPFFCLCSFGGDHLPTPAAMPMGLASPRRCRAGTQSCREDSWCRLHGLPAHSCKAPHTNPMTGPEGEEGKVDSSRCPWC